ncbi:terminase small subunit [Mucilaginibacter gilvus]|nr:terminase small subunit [Mucilaginibacter gilvus]
MLFSSNADDLADRIDCYFRDIQGEYHLETTAPAKTKNTETVTTQLVWDKQPEPALLTGLALFIGFISMEDFVAYEQKGKHKKILRKARLKVEAEYEKRLHLPAPAGAMFALRCMGWADTANAQQATSPPKKLRIEVVDAGPQVSGNEKDVIV